MVSALVSGVFRVSVRFIATIKALSVCMLRLCVVVNNLLLCAFMFIRYVT